MSSHQRNPLRSSRTFVLDAQALPISKILSAAALPFGWFSISPEDGEERAWRFRKDANGRWLGVNCRRRIYPVAARARGAVSANQRVYVGGKRAGRGGVEHNDFGAHPRAVVEIDNIFVGQADAAGGHICADGPGPGRAADETR